MNVSEAVTYSEDIGVERLWADFCRVSDELHKAIDIVLPKAKTRTMARLRYINNFDAQRIGENQYSRTIEIKHIHTKYEFGIDSMFRRSSYVEWPR